MSNFRNCDPIIRYTFIWVPVWIYNACDSLTRFLGEDFLDLVIFFPPLKIPLPNLVNKKTPGHGNFHRYSLETQRLWYYKCHLPLVLEVICIFYVFTQIMSLLIYFMMMAFFAFFLKSIVKIFPNAQILFNKFNILCI